MIIINICDRTIAQSLSPSQALKPSLRSLSPASHQRYHQSRRHHHHHHLLHHHRHHQFNSIQFIIPIIVISFTTIVIVIIIIIPIIVISITTIVIIIPIIVISITPSSSSSSSSSGRPYLSCVADSPVHFIDRLNKRGEFLSSDCHNSFASIPLALKGPFNISILIMTWEQLSSRDSWLRWHPLLYPFLNV